MARIEGRGTIKGGLPVIASFDCFHDGFTGEGYSEIVEIYWCGRKGKKGKPISEKVWDEALAFDDGLSNLLHEVSEDVALRSCDD